MYMDGSDQVNLTHHLAQDEHPSMASDGNVAFSSNRDATDGNDADGFDIYLRKTDSLIVRLTSHAAEDNYPALAPGGDKLAFVSYRDGNAEIYALNLASSGNPSGVRGQHFSKPCRGYRPVMVGGRLPPRFCKR